MSTTTWSIPSRPLGKTGVDVSILALGGWHIGFVANRSQAEAIRIMHAALDAGLTFFDNAWDYHWGGSEEIMGKALAQGGKRAQAFLMTKNCERDYQGSLRCLDDSLRRLRTDHIDLWQFHEICYDNDPQWVFDRGGLRAAIEARQAGKVRFIGFTGHKDPALHLAMLGKPFAWDACQMPTNVMDAHYRSFQQHVLPVCRQQGVGAIGMKSLGGGSRGGNIVRATGLPADVLVRYALGLDVASLVVGIESMKELEQHLAVAHAFRPLADAERDALVERVRDEAGDGRHERFKSTQDFDGPHHRAQHGFS
jgi:aryl-alcohol dehydrogenase-like predicted oxidoreductase